MIVRLEISWELGNIIVVTLVKGTLSAKKNLSVSSNRHSNRGDYTTVETLQPRRLHDRGAYNKMNNITFVSLAIVLAGGRITVIGLNIVHSIVQILAVQW
jgi:hypothetical protein